MCIKKYVCSFAFIYMPMTDFKQDRAIYLQMAERICDEILAGKYNENLPELFRQMELLDIPIETIVKQWKEFKEKK